ncbi:MAG: molybdate ABC transporter substrate-binding protein [Ilumatobacter sp.]
MTRRWIPALLVGIVAVSACGTGDDDRVLVFAAASLAESFETLETAFETEYPELDIEVNVAGSSALRLQIEQGAPADVVAVANQRVMTELAGEGHVASSQVFATNSLVVAVPIDNPGGVTEVADLTDDELLIGVCAPQVPCGEYANDAATSAGLAIAADSEEPDVRSLTAKLATGELDAGIIYATDAASRPNDVVVVATLDDLQAIYPIGVLTDAPRAAAGALFIEFVLSESGQAVLAEAGFGAP